MKISLFPDNVSSGSRSTVNLLYLFFCLVLFMNTRTGFITMILLFSIASFVLLNLGRYFDKYARLILLYSLSYVVIMAMKGEYELTSILSDLIPPIIFYCFGRFMIGSYSDKEKIIPSLILFVALSGAMVYYFTINDIRTTGAIISPVRALQLYGDQGYELGATGIGSCICMGFCGLASFFLVKDKWQKFFFAVIFLCSLITTFHMVNRTGLFISVISLVVVLMMYYNKNKKHLIFLLLLIVGLWFVVSSLGLFGGDVSMAYTERELDEGASIAEGGARTNRWLYALSMIPAHPFGWSGGEYNYIHDMWLDVAKNTGWLPFLFLVVITFKEVKIVLKLISTKKDPVTGILLCLNICMLLNALVEPIIGGFFFSMLCLWWGMQNQYYNTCLSYSQDT